MRIFLRGVSLGILFAAGVLSYVVFSSPLPEKEGEPETELTILEAIDFLGLHGFVVQKNQGNVIQEKDSKKEEPVENEKENQAESDPKPKKELSEHKEEIVKYKLVISKGMVSKEVTEILYKNGILKNIEDFEWFLEKSGYEHKIQFGTYLLTNQMTFEEIGEIISVK